VIESRLASDQDYAELQAAVTKSELIEKISESLKLPAGKAEAIVNCVFDSMVKALERGEGIEIRGFGSFTVREYKAYEGRNPRTGETVHVAPKRLPFFKVGKDLRERVNAGTGTPLPVDTSPDNDDDVADDPELDEDDDE
jgi:integration host factor subunit beta